MNNNHFICIDNNGNIFGTIAYWYNNQLLQECITKMGKYKEGIKQIVCRNSGTVFVTNNGIIDGNDYYRDNFDIYKDEISALKNIKQIDCSDYAIVFLKNDGTCGYIGKDEKNQRVGLDKWSNITQICTTKQTNMGTTIGLKSDGHCVIAGETDRYNKGQVSNWKDIVQIVANVFYIYGLTKQGTVISHIAGDFTTWVNIKKLATGYEHIVGLDKTGHCFATGDNRYGQCNVDTWSDIVDITCGEYYTIGLKKDGTLIVIGKVSQHNDNDEGSSYNNIDDLIKQYKNIILMCNDNIYSIKKTLYLIKQNNLYYSLKSSFYELGQPKDNEELEKWYKEHGTNDLNTLVTKKNGKSVGLKLDKNDIYKTVMSIDFNEITDKIEYIDEDNQKEIKYNVKEYQLLNLAQEKIGRKFQIGKWEEGDNIE